MVNGRVRDYELTPNDVVYGVQRCLQDESGVVERLFDEMREFLVKGAWC